jgi:hypothetical protein
MAGRIALSSDTHATAPGGASRPIGRQDGGGRAALISRQK